MAAFLYLKDIDLDCDNRVFIWETLANVGDSNAHEFCIGLRRQNKRIDISGSKVELHVIRPDKSTRTITGTVNAEGRADATCDAACYEQKGKIKCTLVVRKGDEVLSCVQAIIDVGKSYTDTIVDPSGVIPSFDEFLAELEECRNATKSANTAADEANTAAGAANKAASDAAEITQTADAAERARQTAETARKEAEDARFKAEQERATAEQARQTAEQERATAEKARQTAEQKRATAEADRSSAEALRETAEQKRDTAEQERAEAEQARADGEAAREKAEQSRATAEQGRDNAEQARVKAETGRVSSETARETAEKSRSEQAKENKAIADRLSEVELVYETLPPSEDGYGRIEQTEKKTTFFLGVPASNFAYATFWIDLETRTLMMRTPNGFSAIGFSVKDRQLTVTING